MVSLPLVEVGVDCMSTGGVGEGGEGRLTIWTREMGLCSDRALLGSLGTLSMQVGNGSCDSVNVWFGFVLASGFSVNFILCEETG